MKKTIFLMLIVSFFSGTLYASEVLYVKSVKAKIFNGPKFSSKIVGELKRGDKLDVIMSEGRWYQVTTGLLKGWINKLCVGRQPPMSKITVIKEDKFDLEDKARKRVSSFTSAGAARGLSPAERKRLSGLSRADYQSLRDLEALAEKISDKEIETFMLSKEGKLR